MATTDEIHERVLAAAQALLAKVGAPSAEMVAAAAGLSRSTYYRVIGGSHEAFLREAGYVAEPTARDRVLAATAALLDDVGFSGLLMDAVAERAGVSRATLYRSFPNKSELIGALARSRASLGLLAKALTGTADQPPAEVLPAMMTAAMPHLLANRGLLRAILAEASVSGPDAASGRAVVAELFAGVVQYLTRQMDAGRLRRTDSLAALRALLGPLLLYAVLQPEFWSKVAEPLPPNEAVAEMVAIWLRGMAPDEPTA